MGALFDRRRLFAHRGDSVHHTENTLDAFEACIDLGCDGIELDVQHTACKTLVVFHDFTLTRLAGIERRIDEMTWDELRQIKIGNGARIPTLAEVFARIGSHLIYDLELKSRALGPTGLEEQVLAEIERSGLLRHVLVSSFNPALVWRFKTLSSNTIPTALIYSHSPEVPRFLQNGQGRVLARPTLLKPEQSLVDSRRRGSMPFLPWTVDEAERAHSLLAMGASGIITNRPLDLLPLFRT